MTSRVLLPVAACAALLAGCGKKGPPLPPIPVLPTAAIDLRVDQRGADALLTFTAPIRTTTGLPLEGLEAVEVYGFTEPLPPAAEPVAPALVLGAAAGSKVKTAAVAQSEQAAGGPGQVAPPGPAAQSSAAATEAAAPKARTVEPAELQARANRVATIEGPALEAATLGGMVQVSIPLAAAETEAPSGWHYFAVRSRDLRGKLSLWSNVAGLLAREALPAPADMDVTVEEKAILLDWEEVPGALGYRIYRAEGEGPFGIEPVHPAVITGSSYKDATFQFGRRYRYRVFASSSLSSPFYEGAAGPAVEVTPRDTFAPAAPAALSTIARSGGVVELFWEPNREADLAGYIVYRRPAGSGDEGWQPITPAGGQRIESFRDTGLASGAVLEYAVSAFDDSDPPNVSPRSAPARQLIP